MAEQLGAVAGDCGVGADFDAGGAVDVVILGDGGMLAQQELRAPFGLVGEVVRASARGKPVIQLLRPMVAFSPNRVNRGGLQP